ncbi:hypothetical protein ACT4XR_20300 (plasmid) [Acinetobacter baumannii]|uniref:hypothetical protein n=1 Tax=Acinetobacter baumannii TaxID=470 RepID=UPI0038911A3A
MSNKEHTVEEQDIYQLDLIEKHRSDLMVLIESLMHHESISFTDPVLRELIVIRNSYDLIIKELGGVIEQ